MWCFPDTERVRAVCLVTEGLLFFSSVSGKEGEDAHLLFSMTSSSVLSPGGTGDLSATFSRMPGSVWDHHSLICSFWEWRRGGETYSPQADVKHSWGHGSFEFPTLLPVWWISGIPSVEKLWLIFSVWEGRWGALLICDRGLPGRVAQGKFELSASCASLPTLWFPVGRTKLSKILSCFPFLFLFYSFSPSSAFW